MTPKSPTPPTTDDPAPVSVIVVNFNGMETLPECLESVRHQSYSPLELVVVDNGSTDGSSTWLRSYCRDGDKLLLQSYNGGFAQGVNAGIEASSGKLVALLNSDAVADSLWLCSMTAALTEPSVGMVASKILFYDRRTVIDKTGHLLYPDGLNRGRGAGDTDQGQFDDNEEVFFPDGCAALYRRSLLEDVGFFDEQFFAYGDDADLGLRARWRGWGCRYAPDAKVYHRHSATLGKYSPEKAFLVERNRIWVALKSFPLPLLLLNPVLTLWRFVWHVGSLFGQRGLAAGVSREHGRWGLLRACIRAYISGARGLVQILRKRRAVFRRRKLRNHDFYTLVRRYRVSARELALRD